MFAVLALVPVAQTQPPGLPWWFWLLLLVIVLLAFILWQRRSQAKEAPPVEVRAPEPAPTVEAPPLQVTEAAPAVAAEAPGAVTAVADDSAAKAAAVEVPFAESTGGTPPPEPTARSENSSA